MIKAMFFDLDGTLLTSNKVIESETRKALMICKNKGINTYVCTARPPTLRRALGFSELEMELLEDGVYYDGACTLYEQEKKYVGLDSSSFVKSIELMSKYEKVNIAVQMEDELHSFRYPLDKETCDIWGVREIDILPFEKIYKAAGKVIKLLAFSENNLKFLMAELLGQLGSSINIYADDSYNMIQVNNSMVNKKQGIIEIISKLNITSDEVAVFGDADNDIEMMEYFKYSVAMGNAIDELKQVAKFVTLSNDDNGIYYALKNLLHVI